MQKSVYFNHEKLMEMHMEHQFYSDFLFQFYDCSSLIFFFMSSILRNTLFVPSSDI